MGFGIDRRARSRKPKSGLRALLGRAPDARETGDRLARLARRMLKSAVIDATPKRITLALHPAAQPARIVVLADGDLELRAETASLGPGYHAHVFAAIEPLLDELEYAWCDAATDPAPAMLAWLAGELRAGATRIGMPSDRSFRVDCAVQTPLGPRDAAWRDRVIREPQTGRDVFAWWGTGPGHAELSRALLAMWFDVPWREPLDDNERMVMGQVDVDLADAHRADPELALPWDAWAELLALLGVPDNAHTRFIRDRAVTATANVGYRRYPMDIELSGGWSIVLSGTFVGAWEDDEARWWATDGERVVEFTSLTAGDETDSAKLLEVAPERHPVIARIADGAHHARAETYDDGDVHVVHGLVAHAPHVGILTCKGRMADEAWALDTWRSLRNAG